MENIQPILSRVLQVWNLKSHGENMQKLHTHSHIPGGKYTNTYYVKEVCPPKCTHTHTRLEVNTQISITWNRYVCLHIHTSGGKYRNNCCLEQICSHKCIYAHNWWISTQTPIMGNRYIHLYTHTHTPGGKYTNMYEVEQICSPKCTHTYTPGSKYTNT